MTNLAQALENIPKHGPLRDQWQRISQRLKAELGDDLFNSWFARMDAEDCASGALTVSVPTRFLRSWIENHYLSKLHKIAESEFGPLNSVRKWTDAA
jgi:chromosomal replication initiator protein